MPEFLQALDNWLTPDRILMMAYIFACAVQALPDPDNSGKFYRFVYGFFHTLAGNIALVRKQMRTPPPNG